MPLYQNSVLNKYLKAQDKAIVAKAYKKFTKYFHNTAIQQNIRESKEEQFQQKFLIELFEKVFGYTIFPDEKSNLTTEFKNLIGAKKADGAILKDANALAVIELKGTKTKDLESIRQQAFDYKANQTGCIYVITSNFEKLRFYINNAVEFEEFNLFTLTEVEFELLYLCLQQDNLLNNVPLQIKEASIVEEEKITKTFYTDYSLFKRELFRDLVKKNIKNEIFRIELNKEDSEQAIKNIKLTLFKKSQKLIDRFLFIFFAEDRDLLPPNSTLLILNKWKDDVDFGDERPLYNLFKQYFYFLDTGRRRTDKRAEIFAYNGGLFKPDAVLDSLQISDDLLFKYTKTLANYDFESQVGVNILGHIFENSLNEIESVNAEIEGTDFDKQKTKRKKDGIFYTPKYITKYIVDNTAGKLCNEKKTELNIIEEEFHPQRQKETKKKLLAALETYREWLLQLAILDPACGSGAFLNQALDFLIKEHQYIDELQTKLLGGGFVFPNIENTVLENNIFGVDLNEESVEIAKLSLWLRTAQPRRKLNTLNNNIKCGNSLINSKAVAGDKAFNWQEEFPEIFAKGGFDVVIGNPPYVRQELIKPFKEYLSENYTTYQSSADLYVYFIELSVDKLISQRGIYSIIVANKWMRANYGFPIRRWLKNKDIIEIIDFGDLPVFEDATAYPCILSVKGGQSTNNFKGVQVNNLEFPSLDYFVKSSSINVNQSLLDDSAWTLTDERISRLLSRLKSSGTDLKTFIDNKMYVGLKTGFNAAFIIDKSQYDYLLFSNSKNEELLKPYAAGRDITRYGKPVIDKYLICIPSKWTNSKGDFNNEYEAWNWFQLQYPELSNHLEQFVEQSKKRTDKGEYWWELRACEYYNEFEKPKIIYSEIATSGRFTIDSDNIYCDMTAFIIGNNSPFLLAVLNSKLFTYLFKHSSSEIRGGFLRWKRQYMYPLPIPDIQNEDSFNSLTSIISDKVVMNQTLIDKFQKYLQSQFSIEKLSKKLQNWHELEFGDFIKELNKAIKKAGGERLTKIDEMEWMDVFETKKTAAQTLKQEIDKTDKEIDAIVYVLYGLSEEEIAIVEDSNN